MRPDTDTLTTIALALIAVVAVLTILGILWGARLKRQRVAAERIEEEVVARDQQAAAAPSPPPPPSPLPPPPPLPVAPPPPPPAPRANADPVVEAAPEPKPAPKPAAATPAGPSPADGPVTQLKGLGPKLAERLAELGVTTVGQLAALDQAEAEALDARLGPFTGRMNRDRWLEQARFLAAGDRAGFEAVFGKL
ncbi:MULTISPECIES: hypothetical protein [Sphingomonas]|uniref:hypothetical protein n=1 Tax=Sphingomonas TaxID=13687 RepID=UPI00092BC31A|nr:MULTISPECIES: hypothetical protein [Sphingomonas]MCW6531152.1 hypothetical protein [Sphingomonas lycopersici]OJU14710.1 MAG: hypothetical protein BGN95_22690 [Sphingomonas sp. 66-10]